MKPTFYIDSEIKDIKVGQKYNFTLLAIHDKTEYMDALFESPTGRRYYIEEYDYTALSPLPSEQQASACPKYDPCRKFKKGDRVEPTYWNGRPPVAAEMRANSEFLPHDGIYTVLSDERNSIAFIDYHGKSVFIPVNHLELVTPVEEQGPYKVRHNEAHAAWSIYGPYGLSAVNYFYGERYPYTSDTAKAAAEAECAMLNAEYRKEQNNG